MRRARWAVAGMVALTLAVGAGANALDDNLVATGWHTTLRGEEGSDELVGNFQVHVHGATASPRLDDVEVASLGSFVLVDLSYATTDAWSTPEDVVLIDGEGREYTEPRGFGSVGGTWAAGPDIWFRGVLLFEVPSDVVGDLSLEFRPENPDPQRPGVVLRVPLTVTTTDEPMTRERAVVLGEGER